MLTQESPFCIGLSLTNSMPISLLRLTAKPFGLRWTAPAEMTILPKVSRITFLDFLNQDQVLMANVHDVARYIVEQSGELTAMKLQKLVYYSQAWSLVWDDKLLFPERIEAWANGPVIPELYKVHKGAFKVSDWPCGNSAVLDDKQKETIEVVLDFYGKKTPQWLSDLTHQEQPWRDARNGLNPTERSDSVITPGAMYEYYSSLQ
jgi:uncharacterized phage-associated protein